MSWGTLLVTPADDVIRDLDRAYADMATNVRRLASKSVERGNLHQPLFDGIKEAEKVRRTLVTSVDDTREAVHRCAVRLTLQTTLLVADLLSSCCEAAEAYKLLDVVLTCVGDHRRSPDTRLTAAQMQVPEVRRAAKKPAFQGVPFAGVPAAAFRLLDLHVQCLNEMGAHWSRWGDAANAHACFEHAFLLFTHSKTSSVEASGGGGGSSGDAGDATWQGVECGKASLSAVVAQRCLDYYELREDEAPSRVGRSDSYIERLARRYQEEADKEHASREEAVCAERSRQQESLSRRLEERRARKRQQQQQQPDSAASCDVPTAPTVSPATGEASSAPAAEGSNGGGVACGAGGDDGCPEAAVLEAQHTLTCVALAQHFKNQGNTVLSCFFCLTAVKRELERSALGQGAEASLPEGQRAGSRQDWAEGCLGLASFCVETGDFSHAQHILLAVEVVHPTLLGDSDSDSDAPLSPLAASYVATLAQYRQKAFALFCKAVEASSGGGTATFVAGLPPTLLEACRRALLRPGATPASGLRAHQLSSAQPAEEDSRAGIEVALHANPLAACAEDEALMQGDPHLRRIADKRCRLRLPIPPPRHSFSLTPASFCSEFASVAGVLTWMLDAPDFGVEQHCEQYCLTRLGLVTALDALMSLLLSLLRTCAKSAASRPVPAARLNAVAQLAADVAAEKRRLCEELLAEGFDELVFRNVLRQAHYGAACAYQELAELAEARPTQLDGCDGAGSVQGWLEQAAHHFQKFSARFLKEHCEVQKASTDPKEKSAFLKLEGYVHELHSPTFCATNMRTKHSSDAPAFVMAEIRHAQVLSRYDTDKRCTKDIVAKYKVSTPTQAHKHTHTTFIPQGVVRFIETNPAAVQEYPALKGHLSQAKQMVKLLQASAPRKA